MEERGYDALTVNDLCERADTSRGTFYNHFRDKDGLLAVLEDEVMADLDALQERMQSITLADMLAFRATGRPLPFLVELFDYLREQSDFLHAVLGPGGDVRFGPRLREAVCENLVQNILHEKYRDNPTVFVEILRRLLRRRLLRDHRPLDRARLPRILRDYGAHRHAPSAHQARRVHRAVSWE